MALALTPALAAQGALWGGVGGLGRTLQEGERLDSVVDPETSGHFNGGI